MGEPNKKQLRFARKLLCGVFLAVLAGLFGYWWYAGGGETGAGRYSAAVSVVLFGAVGLRFLAGWTESWFVPQSPLQPLPKQERRTGLWVFFCFLLADIVMLVLVYLLRQAAGSQDSFLQGLSDFLSELAQEKNAPLRAQLENGHKQQMLLAQKLLFKNVNWGKLKPQLTPATALQMVGYLSTGLIQEKAHQPPEQILKQLSQMFSLLRLAFYREEYL